MSAGVAPKVRSLQRGRRRGGKVAAFHDLSHLAQESRLQGPAGRPVRGGAPARLVAREPCQAGRANVQSDGRSVSANVLARLSFSTPDDSVTR